MPNRRRRGQLRAQPHRSRHGPAADLPGRALPPRPVAGDQPRRDQPVGVLRPRRAGADDPAAHLQVLRGELRAGLGRVRPRRRQRAAGRDGAGVGRAQRAPAAAKRQAALLHRRVHQRGDAQDAGLRAGGRALGGDRRRGDPQGGGAAAGQRARGRQPDLLQPGAWLRQQRPALRVGTHAVVRAVLGRLGQSVGGGVGALVPDRRRRGRGAACRDPGAAAAA